MCRARASLLWLAGTPSLTAASTRWCARATRAARSSSPTPRRVLSSSARFFSARCSVSRTSSCRSCRSITARRRLRRSSCASVPGGAPSTSVSMCARARDWQSNARFASSSSELRKDALRARRQIWRSNHARLGDSAQAGAPTFKYQSAKSIQHTRPSPSKSSMLASHAKDGTAFSGLAIERG